MDEWSRVDLSQLFDLSGRVVLMAGGAGVLGCVACEALAAHGATVVIGDNRLVAAMATAYSMVEKGLAAHPIEVDLGDEASILPAIDQVHQRFGRLDVAINAATYSTGKPME